MSAISQLFGSGAHYFTEGLTASASVAGRVAAVAAGTLVTGVAAGMTAAMLRVREYEEAAGITSLIVVVWRMASIMDEGREATEVEVMIGAVEILATCVASFAAILLAIEATPVAARAWSGLAAAQGI